MNLSVKIQKADNGGYIVNEYSPNVINSNRTLVYADFKELVTYLENTLTNTITIYTGTSPDNNTGTVTITPTGFSGGCCRV